MYGNVYGNSIFINFGFMSSTPVAFDLISNIDLRTSDSVTHAKLKLLSQVPLSQPQFILSQFRYVFRGR